MSEAARDELRYEPTEKRIRAIAGGDTVVDTTHALLVWEPRRITPSYAVLRDEVHAELRPAGAADVTDRQVLHPGIPFSAHSIEGETFDVGALEGAAFAPDDDALADYVILDTGQFAFFEEDEEVIGHPRDPFHRVDALRTSRPIRIELDGEVLAETTHATLAFETRLHPRFYIPREDVKVELRPSTKQSHCPYKGDASYWSAGDQQDIAWSYEEPYPDAAKLKGLVAFWDERVDVVVDGERRERPGTPIAKAMREEFGV
jgi:uncharacterized protein (DUF427 family)